jgi:hypothetical protein
MEPQSLTAVRGWDWIKQGFVLFMKAPLLWIVIIVINIIAIITLAAIPFVGGLLVSVFMPFMIVGLMSGCRALHNGDELEIIHLFSGFHKHTSPLMTLGSISLVGQYLIYGIMMLIGGGVLVTILTSNSNFSDTEIFNAVAGAGIAVFLGLILFSILLMATQFAPMLIYFNNAPPIAAMKLSLKTFSRNVAPMMVYSASFMLLGLLASLPMMLGWIVLLPVIFTSLYAAYVDVFPPVTAPSETADSTPLTQI